MVVFAGGGSRLVIVGLRPRVVRVLILAVEAAVGAAAEAGTRVGFGLSSGDDDLASFFTLLVLGDEGPWRAAAELCVFKEVRFVSLGSVGDFFTSSDGAAFFADSTTAIGLAAEPLVMGFSILGDTGALGVLGEVGDLAECFAGGTCLVGVGLVGFPSLVVLIFAGRGR
jgi:hypothetical protein